MYEWHFYPMASKGMYVFKVSWLDSPEFSSIRDLLLIYHADHVAHLVHFISIA